MSPLEGDIPNKYQLLFRWINGGWSLRGRTVPRFFPPFSHDNRWFVFRPPDVETTFTSTTSQWISRMPLQCVIVWILRIPTASFKRKTLPCFFWKCEISNSRFGIQIDYLISYDSYETYMQLHTLISIVLVSRCVFFLWFPLPDK